MGDRLQKDWQDKSLRVKYLKDLGYSFHAVEVLSNEPYERLSGWPNLIEEIEEHIAALDEEEAYTPRRPNNQEIQEIAAWLADVSGTEMADEIDNAKNAYIAVFDKYISDGPGYVGKVITVVWGGAPCFFQCFTYDEYGNLREEESEFHPKSKHPEIGGYDPELDEG